MSHFAVTAVGADRPGIVAAVSGVLTDLGCNLEDTSMSILRGHFAMMLVVEAPGTVTADGLESALAGAADAFDLVVAARAIDDDVPHSPAGDRWVVAVYGGDRPGIVHRVTRLLAERGVNIVDVTTRVIGDPDRPVYAMVLEVTLPETLVASSLEGDLAALAASLGVECSIHASEADIL